MRSIIFALLALTATTLLPAKDLGAHPVFKLYVGSWKAAGELKGAEGKMLTVTEEWSGKAEGDNTFVITGTRIVDGDTQPFTWTFTYNEGADTYDAVLTGGPDSNPLRFEAHPSDVTLTMELKTVTGSGGNAISVVESFPQDKQDTFESKVTFTDENGRITLEGVIKNERQKAP